MRYQGDVPAQRRENEMTADRPASGPEASVDADAFKGFEAAGWEHQAPT